MSLNDFIRQVDNGLGTAPANYHFGIYVRSCLDAIVEDNVINVVTALTQVTTGSGKYFNNQTPSGTLIQGYDYSSAHDIGELTTDVALSLLLTT